MGLENKIFDDPSPRFYPLQERVRKNSLLLYMLFLYLHNVLMFLFSSCCRLNHLMMPKVIVEI